MVTLYQLRIFALVAKHQSISKAAGELKLSQPSVSRQLSLLQEALGEALYKKNNQGIELTEAGRLCLRHAASVLSQMEQLEGRFAVKPARATPASLTVGGTYGPSAVFLPSLLAVFQKAHPSVHITLRTGSRHAIEDLVLKSDVEIALATGPSRSARIESEPYRKEDLVLFGPIHESFTVGKEVSLSDLCRIPLIVRSGTTGESTAEQILKNLEDRGFNTNVVMHCDSPDALKTAVGKGVGLGVLYRDLVRPELQKGEFKEIRVKGLRLEGRSYILRLKETRLSVHAMDFLRILQQWRRKTAN